MREPKQETTVKTQISIKSLYFQRRIYQVMWFGIKTLKMEAGYAWTVYDHRDGSIRVDMKSTTTKTGRGVC